jgi:two-component system sensor histidine kinase BarA
VLVTYLTTARIQDQRQSLLERAQSITHQLATACTFAVLSNDHTALNGLARSVLQEEIVNHVLLQDANGRVLISLNKNESTTLAPSSLMLRAPIYRNSLNSGGDPIGQVNLEFSRTGLLDFQQEIIKVSLLFSFLCLLLVATLGQWVSIKISSPLLKLEKAIGELRGNRRYIASNQESSAIRLTNLEGDIDAMVAALRTSHQQLQEQINEATAELRETLEELEIKNAELDIARKKAVQASRVKSEFLANMSHEIRTPMNGVMGYIGLLSKTKLNRTQQGYLRTLRASAENLMVILNDILDFSKIEAGKFRIRQRNFELRETLENAVMLFAANAQYKNLKLILDIEPHVPSNLVGDSSRIAQIVTNFVSNAIKFTDQGEVEVLVRQIGESSSDVILNLLIRDTGIGISSTDQTRLFNAFYQLDTSTTRRHSGTGLGLAICHRLVSMMKGTIKVESELGKGSTFSITLRLTKQESASLAFEKPQPDSGSTLVVSADPLLSRAVRHILEYGGIKTHCVQDFSAVIDCLRKAIEENTALPNIILDDSGIDTVSEDLFGQLEEHATINCKLILLGISEDHPKVQHFPPVFPTIHFANKPPTSRELLALLDLRPRSIGLAEEPTHSLDEADTTRPVLIKIKVLLADDNLINRQLARIFLSQMGIQVEEATNGLEAINACLRECYDLILMDIHMPDIDGLEATRRIRALQNNPNQNIPIVALTADVMNQEPAYYLQVGMNDYLAKPITETTLRRTIEKWCPGHQSIHAVSSQIHAIIPHFFNGNLA